MKATDSELVQAFQSGKYQAFETLYDRYFKKVYEFIFFKVGGNKALAQDVTSETFLGAFESLKSFQTEKGASFSGWLLKIAHNKCIDAFRKKQPEQLDDLHQKGDEHSMLYQVQVDFQTQQILDFLDLLGSDKKELVIMRLWNELSYQEISDITNKSAVSCRQEFSRTIKKIIEHFKPQR